MVSPSEEKDALLPLTNQDVDIGSAQPNAPTANTNTKRCPFKRIGIVLVVLILLSPHIWRYLRGGNQGPALFSLGRLCGNTKSTSNPSEFPITLPVSTELQRHWGPYTPWYAVEPYRPPPDHCTITQVNILQRHGARYPTKGKDKRMRKALEKLLSASEYTHSSLDFLKEYKYDLGIAELVKFGSEHSKYTGKETFTRYPYLVREDNIPFVRASGKKRVIDSATNWTVGFAEASRNKFKPKLSVILNEKANDTLDDSQCPLAGDSDVQVDQWISHWGTPIAARLNAHAPGANLTPSDVFHLMLICPFESTAHISHSPFCSPSLFSSSEFAQLAYTFDVDKFYDTGYGQELGRVQGVGYVNELIARLTKKPVKDHTQTNRTLDGDPETFPLDRNVYIDFTHDNEMIAVYGAVGLFKQDRWLDPETPDPKRTWRVDRLTPFGSRMVTEKMMCGKRKSKKGKKDKKGKEYVRILVNDAVQPLDFCAEKGKGKHGMELCELHQFIKSQSYSRHDGEGDWEKCHK